MNLALLKSSFSAALITVSQVLTSIVVSKTIAVALGAPGLYTWAQLQNFLQIVTSLSSGNIAIGLRKFVPRSKKPEKYILSTLLITIVFSTITITLVNLLSDKIGYYLNIREDIKFIILSISLTVFFLGLNLNLAAIINSQKKIKIWTYINLAQSTITLAIIPVTIYYLNIYIAFIALILTQTFTCLAQIKILKKHIYNALIVNKKTAIKKLLRLSLISYTSLIFTPISYILTRDITTSHFGIDISGQWQALLNISTLTSVIASNVINIYYLPLLSKTENPQERAQHLIEISKYALLIISIAIAISIFFPQIIISLLFSSEFKIASELLHEQIMADSIRILSMLIGVNLIIDNKIKKAILLNLLLLATYPFNAWLSASFDNINMITTGFVITNTLLLFLNIHFNKEIASHAYKKII